jgi:sugar phosphate isomerase/epimerase
MIALQLYTLRRLLWDPDRIPEVLGRVSEIGYPAVELAGLGPIAPERLAGALADAGLVAGAAHVPWQRMSGDEAGEVVEECRLWGCSYAVVPALPEEYRSVEGYARFAAEATEVAARFHDAGIGLAYHNHSFELQRFGGETGLGIIFGRATSLEAEIDTYWVQHAGGGPAAWIRRLRGRVPLVHLKDMDVSDGRPVMAEVGEGNLEWPDVLAACREAGTGWLVVEQDECRRDELESAAISYRNLVGMGVDPQA